MYMDSFRIEHGCSGYPSLKERIQQSTQHKQLISNEPLVNQCPTAQDPSGLQLLNAHNHVMYIELKTSEHQVRDK